MANVLTAARARAGHLLAPGRAATGGPRSRVAGRRSPMSLLALAARRLPGGLWKERAFRVAGRGLHRLGAAPLVVQRQLDGSLLVLDVRSRTESRALWRGDYDADDLAFFTRCAEPGASVMDIGANVGLIAVPLARHLASCGGRLVAVEPVPVNLERLRANVELNGLGGVVTVVATALGEAPGTVTMHKEGASGTSDNALVSVSGEPAPGAIEVPVSTGDELVERLGLRRLDLVKIDVEGYEVEVLRGLHATIERCRPVVYGEFHNVLLPRRGHDFLDVWALFEPLGYRCYAFAGRCRLVRVENPEPNRGNVVLVPAETADALLARVGAT